MSTQLKRKQKQKTLTPAEQLPVQEKKVSALWQFLAQKEQRVQLLILVGLYLAAYFLMQYAYPLPQYTPDTPSYVYSAQQNAYSGYRPMGYSWFLQYFHSMRISYSFISTAQYWIQAFATLIFLTTLKYLFPPKRKLLFMAFGVALALNPFTLYATHWALSDSVFYSLTLIWLASGCWLCAAPNWWAAGIHLTVMMLIIQVRFAGIFYPVITIAMLLWVYRFKTTALAMIALTVLLTLLVYRNVKKTTWEKYGIDTFSGFSGWAQANNALAIAPYVKLKEKQFTDPELQTIHQIATSFPDSVYKTPFVLKTAFMWRPNLAGRQITLNNVQTRYPGDYVKAWIYSGGVLSRYARELVMTYPAAYLQHFLFLNIKQIFYPFISIGKFPEYPNPDVLKQYYGLADVPTIKASHDFIGKYLDPISREIILASWVVLAAALGFAIFRRKAYTLTSTQKFVMLFVGGFGLFYLGFSVIAHPIHLRYLLPVQPLQLCLLYFIVNALMKQPVGKETEPVVMQVVK